MTEATPTTKKKTTRKPAAKKTTTAAKKPAAKRKPASLELPNSPLVFEVFDLVSRQRTKAKKIEALQKHGDLSIKSVLIWNFDETIALQFLKVLYLTLATMSRPYTVAPSTTRSTRQLARCMRPVASL